LGRAAAVLGEGAIIRLDQVPLADRGNRLQAGQISGPRLESQQADSRANCAAADQHDAAARLADRVDLFSQQIDPLVVQRAVGQRDDARAHLHHHGVGGIGDLLAKLLGGHTRRNRNREVQRLYLRKRQLAGGQRLGQQAWRRMHSVLPDR
jgi:hypothetical protein